MSIYTHVERTVKKYTIQDAINQAKVRISGPICINSVQHVDRSEKITLERLNEIADSIVADTHASPRSGHIF